MTIQDFAIAAYCLFQIVGCVMITRAIFKMREDSLKELKQKAVPNRKASNE